MCVNAGGTGHEAQDARNGLDMLIATRVGWSGCPRLQPLNGVASGVCLFFENSTGCRESQCQLFLFTPVGVLIWQFFCRVFFFRFLLESLILAQDERWRRA